MNKKNNLIGKLEIFKSPYDLLKLEIIDWNRYSPFQNLGDAVYVIFSLLKGNAAYLIMHCDLRQAPERNDFPNWSHVGTKHVPIARLYWNWFHMHFRGSLNFSDAPDFGGHINWCEGVTSTFTGDIGKVSVRAFLEGLRCMRDEDFWISIVNEEKQILIRFYKKMWLEMPIELRIQLIR